MAAASLALAAVPAAGELSPAQARSFEQVCAHCHLEPGIGVPQLGDEAAWTERREKGLDTLLRNTVDGIAGMPPLGTCGYCSEDDLRAMVAWLAGLSPSDGAEP